MCPVLPPQLKSGEIYRGLLTSSSPTMNLTLSSCVRTTSSGSVTSNIDSVYIRGSSVRFIVLPDVLKGAPMLRQVRERKNIADSKNKGKDNGKGMPKRKRE